MTWNYQVIKLTQHGKTTYRLHEVYYNEGGEIANWTVEPVSVQGETLEEVRAVLTMMLDDVDKRPVLDMEELCRRFFAALEDGPAIR